MKKYLLLYTFAVALSGCAKLTEAPDSILVTDQFYRTQEDAIAAVNSVYNGALNNGGITMYNRLFNLGFEIQTDDVIAGQRVTNIDVRAMSSLTHSTSNDRVSELWREHYVAINSANIAIDRIPNIEMDSELRARLVNEAKFLRGLLYFNLVRLWGEVPLVLHEVSSLSKESLYVSRAPVEDVYRQVIADLTDAQGLPPAYNSANAGRATGGAAKAVLAKVYLTRKEWGKAAAKAQEVIGGPYGYDLFTNFSDVFNVATKNGKEHIFSAQCKGGNGQGNRLASSCTPVGIPGVAAAGTDEPAKGTYELYAANDKRRDVTFFTKLVSPTNGQTYTFPPRFYKYFDPGTITNPTESNQNVPVIRFAEVLLIYAEAVNEESGPTTAAYDAINRVRARAGLAPLASLSQPGFRKAVYDERRLELMFEFQRWFDLVRTGRLIEALNAAGKTNVQEKHYLLPVPQRERDVNPKLSQNKGWGS
ncbi:RagB/SusD family nutrient uptake outer membrane protein [Chitinophaga lutea]|uniref:RagB/SusD family nutrient uptake outer membrane protein n=1 Tax=Chitinophaga lutea TaxID=2488634 RepID=A0A3N4PB64_9BACT|nr:RagB/SusD family nutrient uptake outer membrane protein [Chitinophaga lutea]RPE05902.1 RagB/SusD family nutrient uptake outer membrane protein [Chitinophaga lutea]